jgi:hypothetical protein
MGRLFFQRLTDQVNIIIISHKKHEDMNKTTFFVGALLSASPSVLAQTWNFNDEPQIGNIAIRYLVDTTSANYNNLTGANQTWDYSMLGAYPNNMSELSVTDIDAYQDIFPDATHMQYIPGFMNVAFKYEANNDKIAHGYEFELPNIGVAQFIFDNRQKMLLFPMTLGTTFEDDLSGTLMLFDEPNNVWGTTRVTADGSGTLLLANNVSYSDVLRIHSQDTLYADIELTGFPPTSATVVRTQYDYVKPGTSDFPLFTHATLLITNPLIGQIKISVVLSAENPTFFVKMEDYYFDEFSISPNPSCSDVRIHLPDANKDAHLTITDLTGSICFEKRNCTQNEYLDLRSLPAGIYFVNLNQMGFAFTKKLVKN